MSEVKASYYEKPTAGQIIATLFIPPLGVALRHGTGIELWISLGLYLCLWLMAILSMIFRGIPILNFNIFGLACYIYSLYVVIKREDPPVGYAQA